MNFRRGSWPPSGNRGFIYVMTSLGWNPSGVCKVGMSVDPVQRAVSINAPDQVYVEAIFEVVDMRNAEVEAHYQLKRFHHYQEFFLCKRLDTVIDIVEKACKIYSIEKVDNS